MGLLLFLFFAASTEEVRPQNALFLGNSYTYFHALPEVVAQLAASAQHPLRVDMLAPGGATLEQHEAAPATTERLEAGALDFLILQEQSTRPINQPEKMLDAVKKLVEKISSIDGQPVLFMTWAREHKPEMTAGLAKIYDRAGLENDAKVAPVGLAWERARKRYPDLKLYQPDGSHPSAAGTYLAACVIAATLFDVDPRQFSSEMPGVSKRDAKRLADIAHVTLKSRR